MADFCNYCARHMWGDAEDNVLPIPPDIDVPAEFKKLEDDTFVTVGICEGCGLIAVAKIHGKLKVAHINEKDPDAPVAWVEYTDKFHVE